MSWFLWPYPFLRGAQFFPGLTRYKPSGEYHQGTLHGEIGATCKKTLMTPTEQAVLLNLVVAARVLWMRLGDASDSDVNQLGAALIAAKALLEAQKERA